MTAKSFYGSSSGLYSTVDVTEEMKRVKYGCANSSKEISVLFGKALLEEIEFKELKRGMCELIRKNRAKWARTMPTKSFA